MAAEVFSLTFKCKILIKSNLFKCLCMFFNLHLNHSCHRRSLYVSDLGISSISGYLNSPYLLFFCRFTAVVNFKTSSMATTSTGATGCVMSTQLALWQNKTWWRARMAGTSTSTPSGQWSPNRSYWSGTARSLPRGSAPSKTTSNRVSAAGTSGVSLHLQVGTWWSGSL